MFDGKVPKEVLKELEKASGPGLEAKMKQVAEDVQRLAPVIAELKPVVIEVPKPVVIEVPRLP